MSVIYLIRHAQASFGSPVYDRLSEIGHQQAAVLAEHLEQRGIVLDAIYSGSQRRHEQTLAAFQAHLSSAGSPLPPVTVCEGFNEYDADAILRAMIPLMVRKNSDFETEVNRMFREKRSFQRVFEQVMLKWVGSDFPANGLETWKIYGERVILGLQSLMDREGAGKHVAVFTSGGAISVCVQSALRISDAHTLDLAWQIMNASITRLKYSGGRIMLSGFNDVAHLEIQKDKQLLTYR